MEVERERVEVEEEEVREKKGLSSQKLGSRIVAVHHGPWDAPWANRGVCWSAIFSFFYIYFFLRGSGRGG